MLLKLRQLILVLFVLSMSWTASAQKCEVLFSKGSAHFVPALRLQFRGLVNRRTGHLDVRQIDLGEGIQHDEAWEFTTAINDIYFRRYAATYIYGLENVHTAYGSRLSQAEKELVDSGDYAGFARDVRSSRVSFAATMRDFKITDQFVNPYVSFVRVFESTIDDKTPAEKILEEKGIKTRYFDDLRTQGYQFVELGKFFISKSLTTAERVATKRELGRWLYDNFLAPGKFSSEKVVFLIDVSSRVHEKAYLLEYGARPISRDLFEPPIADPDNILAVDLQTLRNRIETVVNTLDAR